MQNNNNYKYFKVIINNCATKILRDYYLKNCTNESKFITRVKNRINNILFNYNRDSNLRRKQYKYLC